MIKRKTLAVLSATVVAAAVMAGCSNHKTAETTAPVTTESTAESTTEAATEAVKDVVGQADFVIAGGDGAGLIAAIQAVKEGTDPSKVMILEKSGELGADLASMEDFMNAANTDEQYEKEIEDSFEAFLADIKSSGKDKNNLELAEFVAESGEAALTWLRDLGIELEGVTKAEGSSAARSFKAAGDKKLTKELREKLLKEAETLKIQVSTNTTVEEIIFGKEGEISGVKVKGKDGEKTINCISLLVTDKTLLPLLKDSKVLFSTDADSKKTGLLVDNCAQVLTADNDAVPGLYAAGAIIAPAVYGEKALPGNMMTGTVLFGSTAGTEAGIYVADNK